MKERHGARPESQVCSSLWKELDSMLKYHKQAVSVLSCNLLHVLYCNFNFIYPAFSLHTLQNNSNSELNNMFSQHLPNLLLLAGQTSALVSGIPSLSSQDGECVSPSLPFLFSFVTDCLIFSSSFFLFPPFLNF